MVMMGLYTRPVEGVKDDYTPGADDVPFSDVYIHAMIQDGEGRPMKKSLGNGVDPLDVVATHGADALRFTLAYMTTETQDVRMPVETDPETGRNTSPKFDMGRNFCNKLWNAARFVMMNLGDMPSGHFDEACLALEDKWILGRLECAKRAANERLEVFKFQAVLQFLYHFVWDEYCDWYLEAIKPRLATRHMDHRWPAQRVVVFVLDQILRMLHPFMPYITEEIWQHLNRLAGDRSLGQLAAAPPDEMIITADWPAESRPLHGFSQWDVGDRSAPAFAAMQDVVVAVRNIRNQYGVDPKASLGLTVKASSEVANDLGHAESLICSLANVTQVAAKPDAEKPDHSATAVLSGPATAGAEVYVPLEGLIDLEAERERLGERIAKEREFLARVEKKLGNANFVEKAPAEVVERERARADEVRSRIAALEKNLADLA
jgi:valyl-tRNA synthetase